MQQSFSFWLRAALLAGLLTAGGAAARAQGVGVGTAAPDASAALDIASTSKGLLVPRLTQAQRTAISSPATGLLVYQTDGARPGFWYFQAAGGWTFFNPSADDLGNHTATQPVNLQGQALTGTGASIGTAVGVGVRADGGLNLGQNTAGGNVFVGYQAGAATTVNATPFSGRFNQFSGFQSGRSNTTGYRNVFEGYQSGFANTVGRENVFSGYQSGFNNTEGRFNVFGGAFSGLANTSGLGNVFTGYASGRSNTTGNANVFGGFESGRNNTTGAGNVFSGYESGQSNTTGNENVFGGYASGKANTTGSGNVFAGYQSGLGNTTGNNNVFSGYASGLRNTTGFRNIFIGLLSGQDNTTGENNIALGTNAGPTIGNLQNTIALGDNALVVASNTIQLGNNGTRALRCQVGLTVTSDARFKYDVQADVPGLAFVQRLRPVTYRLDAARQDSFQRTGTLPAFVPDAAAPVHTGFLAQEVAQAAQGLGFAFDGVHAPATARDPYGLEYARFVVPLVRAVQEQQSQIEALQAQNRALQTKAVQADADHAALLRLQTKSAQTEATLLTLQAQMMSLLGQGVQAHK